MERQVKIALAALLLVLAVVPVWQGWRDRELVYQGKRITSLLREYGTNHWSGGRNGPLDKQIETAVRQIGTNAIPFYLQILARRESALSRNLLSRMPKRWLTWLHPRDIYDDRFLGAYGLILVSFSKNQNE